jgi:DNA replication protein DnaC
VSGALYVTEDDLTRAAVQQFSDDKSLARHSRDLLSSCIGSSFLVLDELGGNRAHGYSPREMKELLRVLHSRLSERRPTMLISNLPPKFVEEEKRLSHLGWLDERIDSRFEGCGLAVECTGPDMRIPT